MINIFIFLCQASAGQVLGAGRTAEVPLVIFSLGDIPMGHLEGSGPRVTWGDVRGEESAIVKKTCHRALVVRCPSPIVDS